MRAQKKLVILFCKYFAAPEPCEIMLRPCDSDKEVCINKKRGYACACKEGYYKESEFQEDCKGTGTFIN